MFYLFKVDCDYNYIADFSKYLILKHSGSIKGGFKQMVYLLAIITSIVFIRIYRRDKKYLYRLDARNNPSPSVNDSGAFGCAGFKYINGYGWNASKYISLHDDHDINTNMPPDFINDPMYSYMSQNVFHDTNSDINTLKGC